MIVRMKKLTMLVSESARHDFLLKLRKAGLVHVKHLKPPSSSQITRSEDKTMLLDEAINILNTYKGTPAKEATDVSAEELINIAGDITERYSRKEAALRNISQIKGQIEWFKPWGGFDPNDLDTLKEGRVFVRLYRLRPSDLKKISNEEKEKINVIKKDSNYAYVAFVSCHSNDGLDFDEIRRPERSLRQLQNDLGHLGGRVEEIEAFFKEKAVLKKAFREEISNLKRRLEFLRVNFSMGDEEEFSYLQGFCPKEEVGAVTALCRSEDAGYLIEDPKDPDETPTLIKNPKWVNIISPVFKFMNTMPGYREYDISLPFLIFFSLFFAMLIGDAGYGISFLVITYFLRRRLRHLPSEPFILMYFLGSATVVWGAVTGTWFGVEKIAELPIFSSLVADKISSFAVDNQNFMIYLCFVIGAVHLSVAHLMQAIRTINSIRVLAQAGWILVVWGLFFAAGTFVIGKDFPALGGYLLASGAGLILFFSNFQKNFIKGVFTTLADLPLRIISSFSDVVSYLRLFAVGYASLIMAKSFNEMALGAGFGNVISGLGAALILFFGHALNIALGLMAVVVHGIRLNMLEFSGHLGMQWSGKEYTPFKEG